MATFGHYPPGDMSWHALLDAVACERAVRARRVQDIVDGTKLAIDSAFGESHSTGDHMRLSRLAQFPGYSPGMIVQVPT